MHGGGADSEALAHRAQGLPLKHHGFHHLLLTPIQASQGGHRIFPLVGDLRLGQPVIPQVIQTHRSGVLQAPRR
jgi:hypothetical protein